MAQPKGEKQQYYGGLAISPDGAYPCYASDTKLLVWLDMKTGKEVASFDPLPESRSDTHGSISAVNYTPSGLHLVITECKNSGSNSMAKTLKMPAVVGVGVAPHVSAVHWTTGLRVRY